MFRLLATSSAALIAAAAPVLAEVTPAQVWDNLSAYYATVGYDVSTGGRDEAGDTLTLTDVAISLDGESSDANIAIPKIVLQQTGDARVRTMIDGQIVADMTSNIPNQENADLRILIDMPGNEMLSSGTPEEMTHDVTYPEMRIALRFGKDGIEGSAEDAPLTVRLSDLTGTQRNLTGTNPQTSYDLDVRAVDMVMEMAGAGMGDDPGTIRGSGQIDGLSMTGTMTAPEGQVDAADNPHEALNAGMMIDATLTMGALTGNSTFNTPSADGGSRSGSSSFESGESKVALTMSRDGISYGGTVDGTRVEMSVPGLPFPISYAIDSASGTLALPVSKSEEPQPYRVAYDLSGLTLADGIWNLFDPDQKLPRDPASLSVDVEGTAIVKEDLLDPAMAQRMEQPTTGDDTAMPSMPFRAETVTINKFSLDAVGAKADVTGDLTIPEDGDQPVGTISGQFAGINPLLETLASMGIMPQEQIMGTRMMIAMFARPAEGNPDQLQTELEFRQDGSIFANGQQVK